MKDETDGHKEYKLYLIFLNRYLNVQGICSSMIIYG